MIGAPPRSTTSPRVALALGAALLLLAFALDGPAFRALNAPDAKTQDWHRLFRVMGYWPTWWLIGAVAWLLAAPRAGVTRRVEAWTAALFLVWCSFVAGLAAEIAKLLLRRERPGDGVEYVFRAFGDRPFSTSGLGLPSSHAGVAAGGAAALWILFPRGRPIWALLALGCATTRVLDRAHWLSDVAVGVALGAMVAWLSARVLGIGPEPGP
jgi:membrane-associated phospholipid phosphatase